MTFSIITPIYNMASTLDRAIKSVLAQSHDDWELIIVDNCSEDHPEDVVQNYAKDDRIRFFSFGEKDRSKARNHGIKESRGEYVTFLDADDTLHEDYLKTYRGIFEVQRDVICISDLLLIKSGRSVVWAKSNHKYLHKLNYCVNHGNMAFSAPKQLFNNFQFGGQTGEDKNLLSIASEEYDLQFTKKAYYNYFDAVKIQSVQDFLDGKNSDISSLRSIYDKIGINYSQNYPFVKAYFELLIIKFYTAMSFKYREQAKNILFNELPAFKSLKLGLKYFKARIYYVLYK